MEKRQEKKGGASLVRRIFRANEMGILLITIALMIIVQLVNPVFMTYANITNVLRSTGYMLIPAIGMTMIMIIGGIDLSVGSVLGLGGTVTGMCLVAGMNIPFSIIVGLAMGALCGFGNGFIISTFKIPAIMMTLGTYYMARGAIYILTEGVPVFPMPEEFMAMEQTAIIGLPSVVFIAIILAAVFFVVLNHTIFGRKIYAIGGNLETAIVSGINVKKVSIACYTITGILAALTGIFQASRLGSAQPSAGTGYELQVIAATVIGGTSTYGGRGTLIGTAIGAVFMNVLSSSMTVMKVSVYWQNFIVGAVLVVAVVIDQLRRNKTVES